MTKRWLVLECDCRESVILICPEDVIIIEDGQRVEVDTTCPECGTPARELGETDPYLRGAR